MSRESRSAQLQTLMDRTGVDVIVLRRPPNFAWFTDGGDNRVDHGSPIGVADIVVAGDHEFVLTNNIEARRMSEEQTPSFEIMEYPWYDDPIPALRQVIGDVRLGSDAPMEEAVDLSDAVAELRWVLDEDARARYAQVGEDAQSALDSACSSLHPGVRELDAAAEVAAACGRAGLFSPVILAAADDRISAFRHPVPGQARAQHRLMLVLCAERGGLFANMTQFVHFDQPDAQLRERLETCSWILQCMREATAPGRPLADVLQVAKQLYADAGFPDEWKLHHQGGLTGYASRELVATPTTDQPIQIGQAFAWNPSITGAKAEETFLLSEDGPRVLARGRLLP